MQYTSKQQATPIMIGAEVFIEPGQTPKEIDLWFKRLQEAGMTVTRIRLFETYMHKADGKWDFTLFDEAYKAADKYGIKVYGNLFPATAFTDLGGLKFPKDENHLVAIERYVENVISHFKQFNSCYGWVPVNEPGVGHFPQDQHATDKYSEWKAAQAHPEYTSGGYDHFDFADERFHLYYNTWFLQWLTGEIYKHDPESIIHVNNHAIFKNVAEYDFTAWRDFLTSLGGSAHASWHFDNFSRQQYALAIAANCEIIRSGAGETPWFMTELQGGNNTYSGFLALCPTKEEIAQWLWIAIGSESKGAIFWCLNPRSSGIEAGEWGMLNYHNEPSDRLQATTEVINTLNEQITFFEDAKELQSGINIIYIRESLWIEKKLQMGGKSYEGRDEGGVMKSAIAYFEALSEAGVQANLKEISEFDFYKDDYIGAVIILAHQISIPSKYWILLETFVLKGGKLIADGLTGYYDENAVGTMRLNFPLRNLFGADVLEYIAIDEMEELMADGIALPAYQWRGELKTTTATALACRGENLTATQNMIGKGTVYWLPSLIGLGSRILGDYNHLNMFLAKAINLDTLNLPFVFEEPQKGILMKVMGNATEWVTIIINKSETHREFKLILREATLQPIVIFANNGGKVGGNHISIEAEKTLVIKWV
ncbi:beta-galactosidase trimerization domain-containing protein [Mucilaginibacter sp. RB4R14]|uniref:beta-galactosidase trimerization domain-containing protein n=1 Tax=Mucilaginibacter aurantiaciroseus TaxID=2949308 RepID=UPI002090C752|nr:beta-galactosidase trimerization domain-containing protein [Mucilaginibacter aurantiaciroseus]MCO5936596.1 beta-galactosidase trimerization domain-containing protein [Mucilaginibacter aurantiaciroseus]